MRLVFVLVAVLVSATATADYLVTDGTVVGVANTSNNQANFGVLVSGGSGNLCEGVYIEFQRPMRPTRRPTRERMRRR